MFKLLQIKILFIVCVLITSAFGKVSFDVSYTVDLYSQETISGILRINIPNEGDLCYYGTPSTYYLGLMDRKNLFVRLGEWVREMWNYNKDSVLCYDSESIYFVYTRSGGVVLNYLEEFPKKSNINPVYTGIEGASLSIDKDRLYLLLSEGRIRYDINDDSSLLTIVAYDIGEYSFENKRAFKMELGTFEDCLDTSIFVDREKLYIVIGDEILTIDVNEKKVISTASIKKEARIEAVLNDKVIYSIGNAIYSNNKVVFDNYKFVDNYNCKFLWIIDKSNNVFIIDDSLTPKKIGLFPDVSICSSGCYDSNTIWIQENNSDDIKIYTMDIEGKMSVSNLKLNYNEKKGFYLSIQ